MKSTQKYVSAKEALSEIKSGQSIFIHSAAAPPQALVKALTERAPDLRNVNIYQLHTEGVAPYTAAEYTESFNVHCFFIGSNTRKAIQEGRADYIPIFLSEIPSLFRKKIIPIDVVLIQVSPPDNHGFFSLGVSVEATKVAVENASMVIAQVNPNMPRTHGNSFIHSGKINYLVHGDDAIPEMHNEIPGETDLLIGKNIASLIEDGATLQMGIGKIPDASLSFLTNHKQLGIHTEMFSDGILSLVEKGIVTGEHKKIKRGKIVSSFVIGSRKLYDFINDNPMVELHSADYVNDTSIIKLNPKVTAINCAIEVDITGQVCADSVGSKMYSGVGGQMDFIRGASLSDGGKPIIALNSITAKGESKIVPVLKEGAGVVTTRAHVHYVVTEYGIADLYGKNIRERIKALVDIAHPDFREYLMEQAFVKYKILFANSFYPQIEAQ